MEDNYFKNLQEERKKKDTESNNKYRYNNQNDFIVPKSIVKENYKIIIYLFTTIGVFLYTIFSFIRLIEYQNQNQYEYITVLELFTYFIIFTMYFVILWISCLVSILRNDFKKDVNKIIWLLAIILVPPTSIIYPFFSEQRISKK